MGQRCCNGTLITLAAWCTVVCEQSQRACTEAAAATQAAHQRAAFVETGALGDFRDGQFRRAQQAGGRLCPSTLQIFVRADAVHRLELTHHVKARPVRSCGQLVDRQRTVVARMDEIRDAREAHERLAPLPRLHVRHGADGAGERDLVRQQSPQEKARPAPRTTSGSSMPGADVVRDVAHHRDERAVAVAQMLEQAQRAVLRARDQQLAIGWRECVERVRQQLRREIDAQQAAPGSRRPRVVSTWPALSTRNTSSSSLREWPSTHSG